MAWFKVDDKLHSHKKTMKAGEAMALWVIAGSWCADHMTDGFIPAYVAERLLPGAAVMADKLVEVDLWSVEVCDDEDGWRFNDWGDYQPTRSDVDARRERERNKKRRQRRDSDGQFDVPDLSPGDSPGDSKGTPAQCPTVPTRPDPTPPHPQAAAAVVDKIQSQQSHATVSLTDDIAGRIDELLADGWTSTDIAQRVGDLNGARAPNGALLHRLKAINGVPPAVAEQRRRAAEQREQAERDEAQRQAEQERAELDHALDQLDSERRDRLLDAARAKAAVLAEPHEVPRDSSVVRAFARTLLKEGLP